MYDKNTWVTSTIFLVVSVASVYIQGMLPNRFVESPLMNFTLICNVLGMKPNRSSEKINDFFKKT